MEKLFLIYIYLILFSHYKKMKYLEKPKIIMTVKKSKEKPKKMLQMKLDKFKGISSVKEKQRNETLKCTPLNIPDLGLFENPSKPMPPLRVFGFF
jgi:hypothetical protein